ncbi:Uncharacterised protein [Vibrio cholerae]|nr:Uncharacterised protein [Vibrio cholerae]CSD09196.1 Uncharacterised protein [Vibrio cholerae]CSI30462.1 Uncharacterised protein [Vibrio cholerae]CSI45900.1 Uncharacterised protein [Vibrio cholerae]
MAFGPSPLTSTPPVTPSSKPETSLRSNFSLMLSTGKVFRICALLFDALNTKR